MAEHECTCTNCGGREHCKIKFEPSRKRCCFWKPELKPIWIPCSERMPETDTPVICYMRIGQILVMELSDDDGWYCGITRYNPRAVTHWMPLPEPPKEDEA